MEREKLEQSLAMLVARETQSVEEEGRAHVAKDGREKRDEMWWDTWKEMGFDAEIRGSDVWPVGKMRRGVAGSA